MQTFYTCTNIVRISLLTLKSLLLSSLLSPSSPVSTFQKNLNHFVTYMEVSMESSSIFQSSFCFPCSFTSANARAVLCFLKLVLLAAISVKIFGTTHKSRRSKIYVATWKTMQRGLPAAKKMAWDSVNVARTRTVIQFMKLPQQKLLGESKRKKTHPAVCANLA